MADRPILYYGPMVRALLAGTKTQTRRLLYTRGKFTNGGKFMKGRRRDGSEFVYEPPAVVLGVGEQWNLRPGSSAGDRLWVREAWQTGASSDGPQISYRATPDFFKIDAWDGPDEGIGPSFNYDKCPGAKFHAWLPDVLDNDGPWRPGIHLPRWASRLTLIVESVKVERLQDISREDAIAEGMVKLKASGRFVVAEGDQYFGSVSHDPREVYSWLWESINGPGSWSLNPWVVATTFRVIKANIDAIPAEERGAA